MLYEVVYCNLEGGKFFLGLEGDFSGSIVIGDYDGPMYLKYEDYNSFGNDFKIKNPSLEIVDEIRERAKFAFDYNRVFEDTTLENFLKSKKKVLMNTEQKKNYISLADKLEEVPYIFLMKDYLKRLYNPSSERYKELSFLHVLDVFSQESLDRVRSISDYAKSLEDVYDMKEVVVNAAGSTSKGLAGMYSDVELSFFDIRSRIPISDSPIFNMKSFFNQKRLHSCQYGSSYINGELELECFTDIVSNLANLFMHSCYGDFVSLRKKVLKEISEDSYDAVMKTFSLYNLPGLKHLSRFNEIIEDIDKKVLPKNFPTFPTAEYIVSILPSLEEMKAIYNV